MFRVPFLRATATTSQNNRSFVSPYSRQSFCDKNTTLRHFRMTADVRGSGGPELYQTACSSRKSCSRFMIASSRLLLMTANNIFFFLHENMEITAVVAGANGQFSLREVRLIKGFVSLEPKLDYCECGGSSGLTSIGPYATDPNDRTGFVLYCTSHTQECGPVSVFSHLLDSNCGCGLHEPCDGHRGELLFLKFKSDQQTQGPENGDYNLEYQIRTCSYVDCSEADLDRVRVAVKNELRVKHYIRQKRAQGSCAVL